LIVVADQLTKALALRFLVHAPTWPIWPGVFHLTLVINPGVAFGLFRGWGLAMTVLALAGLAGLMIGSRSRTKALHSPWARWGLTAVLAGALGNLIDRLRIGGVVDFLDFRIWPVFNLADSAITIGTFCIVWSFLRKI
jgi:signal peptidase II